MSKIKCKIKNTIQLQKSINAINKTAYLQKFIKIVSAFFCVKKQDRLKIY